MTNLISIVTPVFNEDQVLEEFYRRVTDALRGEETELIFVNDGSTDESGNIIDRLAISDSSVRAVHLTRNFGHQAAVSAGLDFAKGAVVVTIDADLQDPPECIPRLLAAWREGAEVVHAVRRVRPGEPRARLYAIQAFYRVYGRLCGMTNFPGHSGDFRLMARPAVNAMGTLPERHRFVRGLASWVGFRQATVEYERDVRFAGTSKYPLSKLVALATDAIVSFSAVPLRVGAAIGILFSLVAFLAIPVVVVLRLAGLYSVSGIASIHILVLLVGGIQLVFLGVIGEYLGRTYDEAKGRPIYLVRDSSHHGDE